MKSKRRSSSCRSCSTRMPRSSRPPSSRVSSRASRPPAPIPAERRSTSACCCPTRSRRRGTSCSTGRTWPPPSRRQASRRHQQRAGRRAEAAVAGRRLPRERREGRSCSTSSTPARARRSRTTAVAGGAKVIDYDRLVVGSKASYYVSFDNVKVGRSWARASLGPEGERHVLEAAGRRPAERRHHRQQREAVPAGLQLVLNPLFKTASSRRGPVTSGRLGPAEGAADLRADARPSTTSRRRDRGERRPRAARSSRR